MCTQSSEKPRGMLFEPDLLASLSVFTARYRWTKCWVTAQPGNRAIVPPMVRVQNVFRTLGSGLKLRIENRIPFKHSGKLHIPVMQHLNLAYHEISPGTRHLYFIPCHRKYSDQHNLCGIPEMYDGKIGCKQRLYFILIGCVYYGTM